MSENVLAALFARVKLPTPLHPLIIERYGSRYARPLSQNSATNNTVESLVAHLSSRSDVDALRDVAFYCEDGPAANFIICAGVTSARLAQILLDNWILHPVNLMRLALTLDRNDSLTPNVFAQLLHRYSPPGIMAVTISDRTTGDTPLLGLRTLARLEAAVGTSAASSRRTDPRYSPGTYNLPLVAAFLYPGIDHSDPFFSLREGTPGTKDLARVLITALGDATASLSRHAWMLFLDLAESSDDTGLARHADMALLLARHELVDA